MHACTSIVHCERFACTSYNHFVRGKRERMYGDVLGAGVAVTVLISMLHHTGPVLRLWDMGGHGKRGEARCPSACCVAGRSARALSFLRPPEYLTSFAPSWRRRHAHSTFFCCVGDMTIGCPHGLDQPQYVAPLLLLLACWVASSAPTVPSSSSRHALIYDESHQPCVSGSPLPTSSSLFVRYRYTRLGLLPPHLAKRAVMSL